MNETDEALVLLKEIRDLQKAHLGEFKEQSARSIRLAEEAAARQKALGNLYKKVVLVTIAAVAYILWTIS